MLDVHILTMACTPPEWVSQRRTSIAAAVEAAGYPVHVHEVCGVPGHIGRGRSIGYALGEQPYVTYVDCDDYLMPGAFAGLHEALIAGHDAIGPGETLEQGGSRWGSDAPHHLICYRRGVANGFAHAEWSVCGDLALAHSVEVIPVHDYSYVHRLYESPGRKLRRQHQDELQKVAHG